MLRTAYGLHVFAGLQEKFENTKLVIRIRTPKKDRHTMAKRKKAKGQITIYKTYT